MKHNLPAIVVYLILVTGILVIFPIGRGSSSANPRAVVQQESDVFLAEIDDQVCVSESPVHTTSSRTAANAGAEDEGSMPSIYLVMLENGVCASLSPIATTMQVQTVEEDQQVLIDRETAAEGAAVGVWYVQN